MMNFAPLTTDQKINNAASGCPVRRAITIKSAAHGSTTPLSPKPKNFKATTSMPNNSPAVDKATGTASNGLPNTSSTNVNATPAAKAITGNANIAPTRIKSCVESCAIALLTPSRNASHAPVSCGSTCPKFKAFNAPIQPWPMSLATAVTNKPTSLARAGGFDQSVKNLFAISPY